MFDGDARLVIDGKAARHAFDQLQARKRRRRGRLRAGGRRPRLVDQIGVGDQFRKHHRHRLQCLDLDIGIAPRLGMLDAQDAHRAFAPDNRHAGETVELLFAGFRLVGEIGVARRFVEVQRLDIAGDRADQPFTHRQLGDVDGLFLQPARREQLQQPIAQQIDRADLAIERLADDLHHRAELRLRRAARSHHIVQAHEDFASGCGGGNGHERSVSDRAPLRQERSPPSS